MCVIDQTTYVHESGRQETIEKRRLCHNAVGNSPCRYVERRDRGVVRTVERRPSPARKSASGPTVPTKDNQQRRYIPLSSLARRSSKRTSSGQVSTASTASPVDSAASSSSPVPPFYKEIRPEVPMPPPGKTYPSARRATPLSPTLPPDPDRIVRPDGTASYSRPPSLETPRAEYNERLPTAQQVYEQDRPQPRSSGRRVSFRDRRPSISIDVDAAEGYASGGSVASIGLGQIPRVSLVDKGKGRARVDSTLDDEARQAQLERERLAGTNSRQRARLSRDAEEAARKRAAEVQREREDSSRERKERERRKAAEALEGRRKAQRDEELQRRVDAEYAQVERERQAAEHRRRESGGSSPMSVRSYTYPPGSPVMSRPLQSARRTGPVVVHNYRPTSRGSINERGAAVIDRYARAASRESQQLEEAMAYMELDERRAAAEELVDEESSADRRSGRRSRRDRKGRRENQDYFE